MRQTIAIVEDEPLIAENYRDLLERQGFTVAIYPDRPLAAAAFAQRLPDLAIIDVGLGDEPEGGFDLCRELRGLSAELPIVFLTARDSELDEVSGLRLGADEYLTKSARRDQLLARSNALLRRVRAMRTPIAREDLIERGALQLNLQRMTVMWQESAVDLTVTEFWILHALALHPGHVKNRQQLMDAASVVLDDNSVTSHIKRIRRKFAQLDPGFDAIETAYGLGYRWRGSQGCPCVGNF